MIAYEYEVQGNCGGAWECVTTEETRKGALDRLREYRINERGTVFRVRRVSVLR